MRASDTLARLSLPLVALGLLLASCTSPGQPPPAGSPTPGEESPAPTGTLSPTSAATPASSSTGNGGAAEPREAVETYYERLAAKDYAGAYALLSPSNPNRMAIEDFVQGEEMLVESIELVSLQSVAAWASTAYVDDPAKNKPVAESDRCKRFVALVKEQYKEGMMGAHPSGTYDYAFTVVKDGNGWKIWSQGTLIVPEICDWYERGGQGFPFPSPTSTGGAS